MMKRCGSRIAMCALVSVFGCALPWVAAAQASPRAIEFSVAGLRLNRAVVAGIPLPAGADARLAVPFGPEGWYATFSGGAGYTDRRVLRDPATGDPRASPSAVDAAYWHQGITADLASGIAWRLLDRAPDGGGSRFELFSSLRARHETRFTSLSAAVFPDMRGLTAFSVLGGAAYDSTFRDERRMRSGYAAETSVEWGPGFAGVSGGTDFFRVSAWAKGFLPIASFGADALSGFSLYAAGYTQTDAAWGDEVPLHVLTSFGGREPASGVGSSVRGYPSWSYESLRKVSANAELRLVGPALFGVPSVRPVVMVFSDAGWYGGLDRASGNATSALRWADADGVLASAGAGAALGILDTVYLGARAGLRWAISDPLYGVYFSDAGTGAFFWDLTLLMHF